MRDQRDFQREHLYGVTQRGNQGKWVYRDEDDFRKALELMRRYALMHKVKIHGYCLMHNHGHWIFEASKEDSISNLMRDMQGNYSRYLNHKYRDRPWVLFVPFGREADPGMMAYFRAGPVNWCPRFDAELLEGAGFKLFLRYLENNPVRARLVSKARQYQWSSAAAHCAGHDDGGLLCLERWQDLFARPGFIAEDWTVFVDGPIEEEIRNAAVTASWQSYNRPQGWRRPEVAQSAGSRAG